MLSQLHGKTLTTLMATAALALGTALAWTIPLVAADETDSYTWSAELVAFDEAARTATVKSYIVGHGELDIATLEEGDPAILTWSGAYTSASGVRHVAPGSMATERFAMPIEYVGTERDNRYLIFRVEIPAEHVDRIKAVEPGQWVTATSPQKPSDGAMVVSAIRSYTDVG